MLRLLMILRHLLLMPHVSPCFSFSLYSVDTNRYLPFFLFAFSIFVYLRRSYCLLLFSFLFIICLLIVRFFHYFSTNADCLIPPD